MNSIAAAALVAALAAAVHGQTPAAPPTAVTPAFDAVVIKRNTSGSLSMSARTLPGGVEQITNGPIRTVFGSAYPTPTQEIVGAPDWFSNERYDITLRVVGNPTREQRQELYRALFGERMKLKAHYETREQQGYALVLARSDGRLGPNIRRSPTDCAALAEAAGPGGQLAPAPPAANGMPACSTRTGGGIMRSGGRSMARLAGSLTGIAGGLVVDKTGLSGDYEFTLEYQPPGAPPTDDKPNIFTALQEQLGLKLEPTRTLVEIAVIDYIERPTTD